MSLSDEPVKSVSWQDLCPWLLILKSIPVSTGMGIIILATIGVVLTPIGWRVSQLVFVSEDMRDNDYHLNEIVENNASPYNAVFAKTDPADIDAGLVTSRLTGPALVFRQIVEPFYHVFHDIRGMRRFGYFLTGAFWTLFLWGFLGTAICRIAILQLTRGERIGIDGAISYALSKCGAALGSISFPLIGVAVLCIPMAGLGLLLNLNIGVLLVGVIWIFVILLALLVAILLIGLLFGWPLAIVSVSAEGQDSFDAMTRSYAYTFQRPLHYIFYALIALLVGGIIWAIAARFTEGVINLSYWGTSWGANVSDGNRIDQIRPSYFGELPDSNAKSFPIPRGTDGPQEGQSETDESGENTQNDGDGTAADIESPPDGQPIKEASSLINGIRVIEFWNSFLRTVAAGFLHGLFWCMFSSVYLLLRRDVDDTELDEVYIDEERQTFDLPPLKNDERGMPSLEKEITGTSSDDQAETPPKSDDDKSNEGQPDESKGD